MIDTYTSPYCWGTFQDEGLMDPFLSSSRSQLSIFQLINTAIFCGIG